jgi:hypothetical protein
MANEVQMTNEEVKKIWEESGKTLRVEHFSCDREWRFAGPKGDGKDPYFYHSLDYRIYPKDLKEYMQNLQSKKPVLDFSKPVQTRDGREVKILCTDAKNEYPISGLVTTDNGTQIHVQWSITGQYFSGMGNHLKDLVQVVETKECFTVLYKTSTFKSKWHDSHELALEYSKCAYGNPIGILKGTLENDVLIKVELV